MRIQFNLLSSVSTSSIKITFLQKILPQKGGKAQSWDNSSAQAGVHWQGAVGSMQE